MGKKKKNIFNPEEIADKDSFKQVSVKCALRKKCKNVLVYNGIQYDVTIMSALAVEASRYIHFSLMRAFANGHFPNGKIDFGVYFRHLCFNQTKQTGNPDAEWNLIRGNRPFYHNGFQRSNIMVFLADQYETSFINNLKNHAYKRLWKFFSVLFSEEKGRKFTNAEIRDTLAVAFYEDTESVPDGELLDSLRALGWTGHELFDLNEYFNYIEIFYRLQRFNEQNSIKNFKLIPQNHFGSIHIRYNQQAMFHLLHRLKLIKSDKGMNQKQLRNYYGQNENLRKQMWFQFACFKPPETINKKFDWSLQTDGVAVSFCMKTKKKQTDGDERGDIDKIRRRMMNGEYDAEIGLDPGYRLMVGGIVRNRGDQDVNDIQHIKISSKEYHNRSGFTKRKELLDAWTTTTQTQTSPMSQNYLAYAIFQMGIFPTKQREFSQRKVVRLKLKKYICVRQTCVKLAKEIIGEHRNAFIAIGSTEFAPNSPIKGYRRTPHKKLVRELKNRADVFLKDEFRTTKLCAKCCHVNITSRSPHRYQFCPNCRTHWHRDVNAGVNILNKAICEIRQIPVHPNFLRSTRLD